MDTQIVEQPKRSKRPKPPGSGRKKGVQNKKTELLKNSMRSAIEICRSEGKDPITIMINAARILDRIGSAFVPAEPKEATQEQYDEIIRNWDPGQLTMLREFLVDASNICHKVAEYGYAKLSRIDYVDDVPTRPKVENKLIFTLNIDSGEAPGRPVQTDMARLDAHVIAPAEYEDAPELTDAQLAAAKVHEGGKPEPEDEWAMDDE